MTSGLWPNSPREYPGELLGGAMGTLPSPTTTRAPVALPAAPSLDGWTPSHAHSRVLTERQRSAQGDLIHTPSLPCLLRFATSWSHCTLGTQASSGWQGTVL